MGLFELLRYSTKLLDCCSYFPPSSGISTSCETSRAVLFFLRRHAGRDGLVECFPTQCRSPSNSKALENGSCQRAAQGASDGAVRPRCRPLLMLLLMLSGSCAGHALLGFEYHWHGTLEGSTTAIQTCSGSAARSNFQSSLSFVTRSSYTLDTLVRWLDCQHVLCGCTWSYGCERPYISSYYLYVHAQCVGPAADRLQAKE